MKEAAAEDSFGGFSRRREDAQGRRLHSKHSKRRLPPMEGEFQVDLSWSGIPRTQSALAKWPSRPAGLSSDLGLHAHLSAPHLRWHPMPNFLQRSEIKNGKPSKHLSCCYNSRSSSPPLPKRLSLSVIACAGPALPQACVCNYGVCVLWMGSSLWFPH